MAMLLERRFPQLGDCLLTAVVLAPRGRGESECDPDMLARTCSEAGRRIDGRRVAPRVQLRPVAAEPAGGGRPGMRGGGLRRRGAPRRWASGRGAALSLSDELWPRRTHLAVPDFEKGPVKVASGGDFEVLVRADRKMPLVPETVDVRYRTDDGVRGRADDPAGRRLGRSTLAGIRLHVPRRVGPDPIRRGRRRRRGPRPPHPRRQEPDAHGNDPRCSVFPTTCSAATRPPPRPA